MVLRIKSTDFSEFSGYKHKTKNNAYNSTLDEYINLFNGNLNIRTFIIEDLNGDGVDLQLLCYIQDNIDKNCKMFTRTLLDDDGNILSYYVHFVRN